MRHLRRLLSSLGLLFFAWLAIGADDCALTQIGQPVPPPSPTMTTTPTLPYCYTDPPLGCAAICVDVDTPGFTAACSNIEAGPRTMQFVMDTQKTLAIAMANDIEVCPAANLGNVVTPCMDGIPPVEWPNQDHTECTTPPPGCPLQ